MTLLQIPDPEATEQLGASIANNCPAQAILYLSGPLGAGKTTFARGFLRARGHDGIVKSPTYALVETYALAVPVYHFDLYRLTCPQELALIGIRDYLETDSICLIEWPEHGGDLIPDADLQIQLEHVNEARQATLMPVTQIGHKMCVPFI